MIVANVSASVHPFSSGGHREGHLIHMQWAALQGKNPELRDCNLFKWAEGMSALPSARRLIGLYYTGEQIHPSFSLEGDSVSIFWGYLLFRHLWKQSRLKGSQCLTAQRCRTVRSTENRLPAEVSHVRKTTQLFSSPELFSHHHTISQRIPQVTAAFLGHIAFHFLEALYLPTEEANWESSWQDLESVPFLSFLIPHYFTGSLASKFIFGFPISALRGFDQAALSQWKQWW